jgi:hypothetical protein
MRFHIAIQGRARQRTSHFHPSLRIRRNRPNFPLKTRLTQERRCHHHQQKTDPHPISLTRIILDHRPVGLFVFARVLPLAISWANSSAPRAGEPPRERIFFGGMALLKLATVLLGFIHAVALAIGKARLRNPYALSHAVPAPNGINARQMNASQPSLDPIQFHVIALCVKNTAAHFGQRYDRAS